METIPTLETALVLTKDQDTFGPFLEGYIKARGSQLVPGLQHYMLDELLPFLEEITVTEVKDPDQVTYRLCGTKVVRRMGQEVTGQNMLDFFPLEIRKPAYVVMKSLVSTPCAHYSRYNNLYASGRSVEAETISLPVRSEAGTNFVLSLHLVEDVVSGRSAGEETQIGTDWSQAQFIDLGNGVPAASETSELIKLPTTDDPA